MKPANRPPIVAITRPSISFITAMFASIQIIDAFVQRQFIDELLAGDEIVVE